MANLRSGGLCPSDEKEIIDLRLGLLSDGNSDRSSSRCHPQGGCGSGATTRRSRAFPLGVFAARGENGRKQRSLRDHFRDEHIWRPARYSGRYRERAQSNENSHLYVHQHKRWLSGRDYRYRHRAYFYGAGKRDWRRSADPSDRRRPSGYREGEDNFILVCTHSGFRE